MAELKEKIVYLSVDDLIPYEYNAREHGSEIEYLKNSIREFGFRNPILIDGNNVIIAGHGRRMAAMDLGMEKVPCIICSDLSDEQVRALRLADNKISDLSTISWDNLNFELGGLKDLGWDMQNFGFEDLTQFEVVEPEPMEAAGDGIDFVTETEGTEEEQYKILVTLTSKDSQNELFEYLLRNGYDCQML